MKITKIRFFEYGKAPPKNSRYKGKITNDTVGGYFDYTGRDEAKDADKTVEKQEDGYFGYTGSHTIGTYSSMGVLNTKEDRSQFKNEINRCFHKNGNLCWDYVISLESDEEAHQLELETGEQWAAVMKEVLPKLFKQYDLDYYNVLWWFDVHRNTEHPHIHLAFMEKKQTRTRGKLSQRKMKNVKQIIYTSLAARKRLKERTGYDHKEYFKNKDIAFKELMTSIKNVDLSQNMKLKDLYKVLPKTGRLQYNSINMKEYQPIIKSIIDDLINSDEKLSQQFHQYMKKLDMLQEVMEEQGGDISSIKEAELNKFYERVGNYILQNYKKSEYIYDQTDSKKASSFLKKRNYRTRKYLSETRIKSYILEVASEQQREIDKAIEEYNKRMESQLLVE